MKRVRSNEKVEPLVNNYSPSRLWSQGFLDVINAYICAHLPLADMIRLSHVNRMLHVGLFNRNINLITWRQVWTLIGLNVRDKQVTLARTGLLLCIKHIHPDTSKIDHVFVEIVCKGGFADAIQYFTRRVTTASVDEERELFQNVGIILIKNNHLELAYSVMTNEFGKWWTEFDCFRTDDKYVIWKCAVATGVYELEERISHLFVNPDNRGRLPGTRLLIAAESLKPDVFDHYYAAIQNAEDRHNFADNAHILLLTRQLQGRNSPQLTIMVNHILERMRNE